MKQSLKNNFAIAVRRADPADLEGVVAVENNCFGNDEVYPRELLQEFLEASRVKCSPVTMLVAISPDNTIAGYGLGQVEEDRTGMIVSLAVASAYQGHGLGRALLDSVSESLCRKGADKLVLQVKVDNASAIHLYESSGFARTVLLPHYYDGEDGIEMTKKIRKESPVPVY
jgi:ribosomal-protein-alanine N-acetyltransferase